MEKKVLTGAIASAVAMAGIQPVGADYSGPTPKNPRLGLDNPLDNVSCTLDEIDGVWASWDDPNTEHGAEGPTKYGGDLEFDAWLMAHCDFDGTAAEGIADGFWLEEPRTIDVDISQDGEEPFHYTCEGTTEAHCDAHLSWEAIDGIAQDAADDRFGSSFDECFALLGCSETVEVCEGGTVEVCEGLGAFEDDGECWVCEGAEAEVSGLDCYVCEYPESAVETYFEGGDCFYCDGDLVNNEGECIVNEDGSLINVGWGEEAQQAVPFTTTEFTEECPDGYFEECSEYAALAASGHEAFEECYVWEEESEEYVPEFEAADGVCVAGNFETSAIVHEGFDFSVKEMNPGIKQADGFPRTRGYGRQNYQKAYAECSFPED